MAIKKQEFYEGAALHILACSGNIRSLTYTAPFFTINGTLLVLLKYSTKKRSPWGFTLTTNEQNLLGELAGQRNITIALVCGSDGVASFTYAELCSITNTRSASLHISCYRNYGEHYKLCGPNGILNKRISPSRWGKLLNC